LVALMLCEIRLLVGNIDNSFNKLTLIFNLDSPNLTL
jgi:hypothetical protein